MYFCCPLAFLFPALFVGSPGKTEYPLPGYSSPASVGVYPMAKFYRRLVWLAITEFWNAADRGLAMSAAALFLIGLLNRKLAELLITARNGVSPWWAVLPIGLFVVYRIMRANYEAYSRLEKKVRDQQAKETIHAWIGQRLQDAKKLWDMPDDTDQEFSKFRGDLDYWVIKTETGLTALGLTAESQLFATADSGFARLPKAMSDVVPAGLANYRTTQDIKKSCRDRLSKYETVLRNILQNLR